MREDVCAIIVTYLPILERFEKALLNVCPQCKVVIVDNSEGTDSGQIQKYSEAYGCNFIANERNLGIAAAQNQGISFALDHGYNYVLLLDQDSIVCDGFVRKLMSYEANDNMAVISGRAIDVRNKDVSNTNVKNSSYVEQRDLMSSGTLIHRKAIEIVGLFEEPLFIDCVDFEWGWRARSLGLKLLLVHEAYFSHMIGDGLQRYEQLPSPIRHYYQTRNISYMLTRRYVPKLWKIKQLFFFVPRILKVLIFGSNKKKRIGYIFKGMYDFSKNRFGPLI